LGVSVESSVGIAPVDGMMPRMSTVRDGADARAWGEAVAVGFGRDGALATGRLGASAWVDGAGMFHELPVLSDATTGGAAVRVPCATEVAVGV
jgi:hypothetical protein